MSWHFSRALVAEFLQGACLDGEQFAPSSSMPIALDDSCSDKMKGISHHSPFGMMYVHSTDVIGEAVLTSYLAAFPAKPIRRQLEDAIAQTTFGLRCGGSWQMSLPGTYSPRTSQPKQSTRRPTISSRWDTKPEQLPLARQTWVATTFGPEVGYLHTPTTKANYCAPSMQKWPGARSFVTVFGGAPPDPANQEWLMGWPIGWSATAPLEMGKFQLWRQAHCLP